MPQHLISPTENFRELLSYRKAAIICDGTSSFCSRFIPDFDQTGDQMIQEANAGKANILEGSLASSSSNEAGITLLMAARAKFEDLLEDYQDFLTNNNLTEWTKDSSEARYIRKLGNRPDFSIHTFQPYYQARPAKTVANILICLIHQAILLLDRQIRRMEKDFMIFGSFHDHRLRSQTKPRMGGLESVAFR